MKFFVWTRKEKDMRTFEGYQKGMNLGGWISQCRVYETQHYDSFIKEEDIKEIASWGVDHIRLPLDYNVIEEEDGTPIEENYKYIDNCIEWCGKYNLNLILDLHKTAGYVFDDIEGSEGFFDNDKLKDRFIALWDKLAAKYAKYSDRMAFELLNEIVDPGVALKWNALAKRAMETIRKYSKDAYILVGGINYNSVLSVPQLDPPMDDKIVYNFHCYDPQLFTHQSAYWQDFMPKGFHTEYPMTVEEYEKAVKDNHMPDHTTEIFRRAGVADMGIGFFDAIFAPAIEYAKKMNAPLYCGEYGVIDQAPADGTVNWYKDIHAAFEKHGIGRAAWTYKEMDFGLTQEHVASVKEELIKLL